MIKLTNIQFQFLTSGASGQTSSQTSPMQFDLHIKQGEKFALIGASGSGKSTLLNLIAGFLYADNLNNGGVITLNGERHNTTKPYQRPVSMLFQDNNLFNHLTIADNIGLGLQPNLKFNTEQKQRITDVAKQVGLATLLQRKPAELSGGQKQRVALARCLLRDKPILLLDEPFSALDKDLRLEMMALLNNLCQKKNLTLLLVTHQPEELANLVDRVIKVENGKINDGKIAD